MEIIGVVGHIHHEGLDSDPRPQVYFNYLQRPQDRMAMVIHVDEDIRPIRPAIMQAIHDVDPDQPVYDVRLLAERLEQSVVRRWLNVVVIAGFATIALLVASIGVYGVMAYGVSRQVREFGIRRAVGATQRDITRAVLMRGITVTACGVISGVVASLVLTRLIQSLLFNVSAYDGVAVAGAVVVLVALALVASYVPARRAAAVNPALTLHAE